MSMINWNEFEHIHVIKKLKQILNSWWNIDLVFTDERGEIKGFSAVYYDVKLVIFSVKTEF